MTHAALKDLENKWRAEAADLMRQAREAHYLTTLPNKAEDITRCADELSAALSAVEGEAVLEIGECAELTWLKGGPCAYAPGTKFYTAPPPQQED